MKKSSLLYLLLFAFPIFSCSSNDDSIGGDSETLFQQKMVRVELTALTENPENYEDISIKFLFESYTEPEIETTTPADSTEIDTPGINPIVKDFYYSYSELEESLSFSTKEPVIGGVFSFDTYTKESLEADEDIYEVKIYQDDELVETRIISGEQGDSYIGDEFLLMDATLL